mmetsp:Transcript_57921/g.131251  ORF Transcript_57921/g.131251 Transcript_57921/m.131251 type:complete len:214 (-) Transcript_57921:656-1297(-)
MTAREPSEPSNWSSGSREEERGLSYQEGSSPGKPAANRSGPHRPRHMSVKGVAGGSGGESDGGGPSFEVHQRRALGSTSIPRLRISFCARAARLRPPSPPAASCSSEASSSLSNAPRVESGRSGPGSSAARCQARGSGVPSGLKVGASRSRSLSACVTGPKPLSWASRAKKSSWASRASHWERAALAFDAVASTIWSSRSLPLVHLRPSTLRP